MKITINIDCTPKEARSFLGLPDVEPLNEAMTRRMGEHIEQYFATMDPETFMKTWFPAGLKGWEQLGEAFWTQFRAAAGGGKDDS